MSARKLAKEVGKKHGIGLKDLDSLEDISDKGLRELLKRDSLTGKKVVDLYLTERREKENLIDLVQRQNVNKNQIHIGQHFQEQSL